MLFNSAAFLLWFLPVVLAGHYWLPERYRLGWLLLSSYLFYAYWSPVFWVLMLLSTCIDFWAGRRLARSQSVGSKRLYLSASVGANLLLLGFFKYYGMASMTVNALTGATTLPLWNIVLPIGISFYTFQSMSYSLDIYRGIVQPNKSFVAFACYVSLFPQLIAGPIVRYSEMATQLLRPDYSYERAAEGIYRFIIGLAKKVLIADSMAVVADAAFADPTGGMGAWLGVVAYSFQIYFDFAGYSDMAIGLGLLLGFRFPENFDRPYCARTPSEFWRRWHMTLSRWFRDYLYIPLGGNQGGTWLTLRNLIITMFLAGLWHGASWTFVVWGLYHGILLVLDRLARPWWQRLPGAVQMCSTYLLVTLGWVLFRSPNFSVAVTYLRSLFEVSMDTSVSALHLGIVLAGAGLVLCESRLPLQPKRYTTSVIVATVVTFLVCLVVIYGNTSSPFLYFQF